MPGNPKSSDWYSTDRALRNRRGIELTLPDDARERLGVLETETGESRSRVVEAILRLTLRKGELAAIRAELQTMAPIKKK